MIKIELMTVRNFMMNKVWPVCAGLLTAFIIMIAFEFVNSLIYPLPEGLDYMDMEAVIEFTVSLPWTAYILVFLGWVVGSFAAGYLTTRLSGKRSYALAFIVAMILTVLGLVNNILIGHHILFTIVALPMFPLFTFVGYLLYRRMDKTTSSYETPLDTEEASK